nr:sulfite exporter TauE/SafE family protein [uncultured Selenomonas sp.]
MENYLSALATHTGPLLAIFFAAFLQSITGFGLVIVAAPLLMFFYDPKIVVPVMLLLACSGNTVQAFLMRKKANLPLIGHLAIGVVLGVPIGFLVFDYVSSDTLKIWISTVVFLSLLIMQVSHRHIPESRRNTIITGICAGFSSMTTGMAGPPFLIYLAYTKMSAETFRATCFVFFLCCNSMSLIGYLIGGHPLTAAVHEFICLLPALAAGLSLGHALARFIPTSLLRRLIFLVLYAACLYTIWSVVSKG